MSFSYPQIILFGDSLTQLSFCPSGIAAQLAQRYARKADVLNRGVSGYNSRWLLPLFRKTLTQLTPANNVLLYVIWVGANDACLPGSPHHVPLNEFTNNLHTMITELRAYPVTQSTKILLITPPPIYVPLLRQKGPREGKDRDYEVTRKYADASLNVAKEFHQDKGIATISLHELIERETCNGCTLTEESENEIVKSTVQGFFTDGLHLDRVGYDYVYREIMKKIDSQWPEIGPETIPLTASITMAGTRFRRVRLTFPKAPWWGDMVKVESTKVATVGISD